MMRLIHFFKKKGILYSFFLFMLFLFTACQENQAIVNNIDEREATEIIVFLYDNGIKAEKVRASGGEIPGAIGSTSSLWNITVPIDKQIQAMSLLTQNGLPRRKGFSMLELFAKQGLMTSDKEETIRYQAGKSAEIKNTIQKIDGVLEADVQISFPLQEAVPGAAAQKIKAAVYVKHQGVFDDPNNHLETKIKRLLSGSIEGLKYEDVSVISDKARFADIAITSGSEIISPKATAKEYVSIWSIIMTKSSSSRFRSIFFFMIIIILVLGACVGWLVYRFYPQLQKNITINLFKKRSPKEKAKEEKK